MSAVKKTFHFSSSIVTNLKRTFLIEVEKRETRMQIFSFEVLPESSDNFYGVVLIFNRF